MRLGRVGLRADGLAAGVGDVVRAKTTLRKQRIAITVLDELVGNS